MSLTVMLIVLLAAILHASWNFLVKRTEDKHLSMTAVVMGHIPIAIVVLIFVPFPDPNSWRWIAIGSLLHVGYQLFLAMSYKVGDLTQVYPLARGIAPMLVTIVSIFFLGLKLLPNELLGIITIVVGIISLVFVRHNNGLRNVRATSYALITGCFIAAYSLVDGLGAREAGTALGFYACLSIVNGLIYATAINIAKPGTLLRVVKSEWKLTLTGGGASFLAYALVIWSFTQAPIALVTALRETSIIIALLLGTVFLKERFDKAKVIATLMTVIGVILLRVG